MAQGLRVTSGRGARRRFPLLMTVATAFLAVTMVFSACAPDAHQTAATSAKTKLDSELHHAKADLGIPDYMLKPIETQEQSIASGANGFNYNWQNAEQNYALLYSQLTGIEQTASDTLKAQVEKDINAFTTALNQRRAQSFSEIGAYQTRLDQAIEAFQTAKTPGDYAHLDDFVTAQTAALQAMWPAYLSLQDFKATLRTMRSAGLGSSMGEVEYTQDVAAFANASSADRYTKLVGVINGQIMQLMADETEAMPYIGSSMLDAFQARIDLLKQYGEDYKSFQQQHDQDAQELTAAQSLADYLTLAQVINKQTTAMQLPLVRGKTRYDVRVLQGLINTAQAANPLNAYEYASADEGIGIVQQEFQQAASQSDFEQADADTTVLITNLRALMDNLHDTTPSWEAHQTDLQLMQVYGIMSGRVVMVSLREQTARFYENGKLVYWSYVTTGRPEKPSPPGLHYAMEKLYHTEFKSGDPVGSALWYAPTPINYAILYANYGFFLHDAWWRYKFGPGSNLPHWDPLAFDGGSHGCVNFPEDNMAWTYNWVPIGAPIVVY
ncbi:MAG TPA: L,D-transpeptidase [Ktedonobacterales bacterium]|nr:L,D-transpeptidase [Ktedonobacterales bacterium]